MKIPVFPQTLIYKNYFRYQSKEILNYIVNFYVNVRIFSCAFKHNEQLICSIWENIYCILIFSANNIFSFCPGSDPFCNTFIYFVLFRLISELRQTFYPSYSRGTDLCVDVIILIRFLFRHTLSVCFLVCCQFSFLSITLILLDFSTYIAQNMNGKSTELFKMLERHMDIQMLTLL